MNTKNSFSRIWRRLTVLTLFFAAMLGVAGIANGACSTPYFEKAYLNEYFFGVSTNYVEVFIPNNNVVTSADWSSWKARVYTGANSYNDYPMSGAQVCTFGSKSYLTYDVPTGLSGAGGAVNVVLYDGAGNEIDYLKFDNKSPISVYATPQCAYPASHDIDLLISSYGNKDVARFPDGKGNWGISSFTGANTTNTRCAPNDATIIKTVSTSAIPTGASASFTISISNPSNASLNNVVVTDMLPPGLIYESSTASTGTYSPSTGLWTVGSLPKNTSATLTINFHGNTVGAYTNTATLSYTGITYTAQDSAIANIVAALNHIRIEHDGEGLTCAPETVTVRACADANCTSEYGGSVTTTLSPGGWLGGNTITYSGGHVTAQLSHTTPGPVTLGAASTSPPPLSAARCFIGANESCNMNFVDTGFIFSNTGVSPYNQLIPPQTAGIDSGALYLVAVRKDSTTKACEAALLGANTVNLAYECADPTSCYGADLMNVNGGSGATTIARNNSGSVSSYTAVNMSFNANGAAPFTMAYSDVGKVRLHASKVVNAATLTGASSPFVVKPYDFLVIPCTSATPCLTAPADPGLAGGGGVFARSGRPFNATITARAFGGATTPSFGLGSNNGTESVNLTHARQAPDPGENGILGGTTAIPRNSFSNGVASVDDLSWDEVGVITLTATNSTFLGNMLTTTGSSGNVGRFIPDHFDTIVTGGMPCPAGLTCPAQFNGFIYSAQPFSTQVIAKNLGGGTTKNYSGAFARDVVLTAWDAKGSVTIQNPPAATPGVLSGGSVTAALFVTGSATLNTPAYTMPNAYPSATAPPAPTDIYLRATDAEGVTSLRATPANSVEGGIKIVSGRFVVQNVYGSELLALPVGGTVQYFNGTRWITSSSDSASKIIAPTNIQFSNYKGNLSSVSVVGAPVTTTVFSGACPSVGGCFRLAAPGAGSNGSVDIKLISPAWLPSNTARATFGIYKSKFIYLREVF